MAKNRDAMTDSVRRAVREIEPDASIILYGSRARGDADEDSDWDLLVLVDGQVNEERVDRIRHLLYEIEWESDVVLSSIVWSRNEWDSYPYRMMPLHEQIEREGILL